MMIVMSNFENYKLLKLIEQTKKNEESNAIAYAHRSTYINPGALRSGERSAKIILNPVLSNFCPV